MEFLNDHTIHGEKVYPATVISSYIVNTVINLFAGLYVKEYSMKIFKGIVGDKDTDVKIEIKLDTMDSMDLLICKCKLYTIVGNKTTPLYGLDLSLSTDKPTIPIVSKDINEQNIVLSYELYNGKTLFHGITLQGIQRILSHNKDGLVAEFRSPGFNEYNKINSCILSQPSNGIINDIDFQLGLVWYKNKSSLPSSGNFTFYNNIPLDNLYYVLFETIESKDNTTCFMCTTFDRNGNVYSKSNGKLTLSDMK